MELEKLEKMFRPSMQWNEYRDFYDNLCLFANENPEQTKLLLPLFYRSVTSSAFNPDIAPRAVDTLKNLFQYMNGKDALTCFDYLLEVNSSVALRAIDGLAAQNKDLFFSLYERLSEKNDKAEANESFLIRDAFGKLALQADEKDIEAVFDREVRHGAGAGKFFSVLYGEAGKLYKVYPGLREKILNMLQKPEYREKYFCFYYRNLGEIAAADKNAAGMCLNLLKQGICSEKNNALSLSEAYKVLENKFLLCYPEMKNEINDCLEAGVNNSANSRSSRKEAWRLLGRKDELSSRVSLGQRVTKNEKYPFGWKQIEKIPGNEVSILFLGGDGTVTDRAANGNLVVVERLLQEKNLAGKVALYAVAYDFGDFMRRDLARMKLMQDYKHNVKVNRELSHDTLYPRYIEEIFNKAFLPRISQDGKRLSEKEAADNVRKLNVIVHCHGAYTFLKLEEMMQQKMAELGYLPEERQSVQKQMLVVAHAPYCPLGVSRSMMISFCSAQDDEVEHYNNFEKAVCGLNEKGKLKMSYFPGKQGNFFLVPTMGKEVDQHNFVGYDAMQSGLSKEGQVLVGLAGNVVAAGVKNSLAGEKLPSVRDLVADGNEQTCALFDRLQQNGNEMYREILRESIVLHQKGFSQKE